jgi:hypothetical protein
MTALVKSEEGQKQEASLLEEQDGTYWERKLLRHDGRTWGHPAGGGGGGDEEAGGGVAVVDSGDGGGGGGGEAVQLGHTVAVDVRVRVDIVEVDCTNVEPPVVKVARTGQVVTEV